jgi:hypothetical protein
MKALILVLALAPLAGCATLERDLRDIDHALSAQADSFNATMAKVDWAAVSQSWADSAARSDYRTQALLNSTRPSSISCYSHSPGHIHCTSY